MHWDREQYDKSMWNETSNVVTLQIQRATSPRQRRKCTYLVNFRWTDSIFTDSDNEDSKQMSSRPTLA